MFRKQGEFPINDGTTTKETISINKGSTDSLHIRPKKQTMLPHLKKVAPLLKSVTNPKHKLILFLTYFSGLRVGEVVRLRCSDLDIERQTLVLRQG